MKYKVVEMKELTKEMLEEMLAEAYEDGYRDGRSSSTILFRGAGEPVKCGLAHASEHESESTESLHSVLAPHNDLLDKYW